MAGTLLARTIMAFAVTMAAPAVAGPYDGEWVLESKSNRSNCGGGTNEITITDGQISGTVYGKIGVYTASGTVSDDGKVKMKLDAGYVLFKGKAKGERLEGTWNAGHCMGRFSMTRK